MNPQHTSPLSRRGLLTALTALPVAAGASVLLAEPASAATAPSSTSSTAGSTGARGARLSVRGADISFTAQLEAAGVRYRDGGRPSPVEQILRSHGANWVRLRLWVNPPAGWSDLTTTIALARRAKRAGLNVLLDLHYSDFWADPAHQTTPAAWAGQDLATLSTTVRRYTADTLRRLRTAGAQIDMVQVGNEITAGMLWPLGQVYGPGGTDFSGFTTLLKAGVAGVRDVHPRSKDVRVMVHIDRGGDNGGSRWFFDHVLDAGVEFDVIGQSYYPFWHGSLEDLRTNLTDLATRYGKDLVVVETAYPWTLENGDDLENLIHDAAQLPDVATYPATPAGQAAYFETLRQLIADVPGGRGLGFFAWEPEWVPGVGWEPGAGNPNDNLTMFDHQGRALPALEAFRAGR